MNWVYPSATTLRNMPCMTNRWVHLSILLVVTALGLCSAALAQPVTVRVLVVPVDFPDQPGDLDLTELQTRWVEPLEQFYTDISNGNLDLQVHLSDRVSRLPLPRRYYNYSRGRTQLQPQGVCNGDATVSCQSDDCGEGDYCQFFMGYCADQTTQCTGSAMCTGIGDGTCTQWTGFCESDPTTACDSSADCPGDDLDTCKFYWDPWDMAEPLEALVADPSGPVDRESGGLTPPGTPGVFFDVILYVYATPDDCDTCVTQGSKICRFFDLMTTPDTNPAGGSRTYYHSYVQGVMARSGRSGTDLCNLNDRDWGSAAHELGHAISHKLEGHMGHPAGYISNYELMDSGYPCSPGSYTRASSAILGESMPAWFQGWIPDERYLILSPPAGTTEVLAPVESDPDATTAPMGIKVELADGTFYMLECRTDQDPALRGCFDGGVVIHQAKPEGAYSSTDRKLVVRHEVPAGWPEDPRGPEALGVWRAHFVTGDAYPDVFTDTDNDVQISISPKLADGSCPVTVTYGPGSTASPAPDVGILPWETPPMNTWETVDLWIDSSCNGYEADDPSDTTRLKYKRRMDGTVIGNGDDPCLDHENRMYARIKNFGTAVANDIVVHFDVTNPLGVGIRGDDSWRAVGTADKAGFPCLAALSPGDETCEVYVTWTPTGEDVDDAPALPLEDPRFALHSCMRNRMDQVTGELDLAVGNQDGLREQENMAYFEIRRQEATVTFDPAAGHIFVLHPNNNRREGQEYQLEFISGLPPGWSLDIAGGKTTFWLAPGQVKAIPVRISVPDGEAIGQSHEVSVKAYGRSSQLTPDGEFQMGEMQEISGLTLVARTVQDTAINLAAQADPPASCQMTKLTASGCLTAPVGGVQLTVDFHGPSGTLSRLVQTDVSGCFVGDLDFPQPGTWTVQALWPGDGMHSSAISGEVLVAAYDPADTDCDGLPNGQDSCPGTPDQGFDSDQDGIADACDCAPNDPETYSSPAETIQIAFQDAGTLTWTDLSPQAGAAITYNLLSGNAQAGGGPLPGALCAGSGLTSNIVDIPGVPDLGKADWYLVQAENNCGVTGVGSSSSGVKRPFTTCLGCDHDTCTEGAPLHPACGPCVASICAVDSYCCETAWDSLCVQEVRTVCGLLECAESAGSCSHALCAAGAPLGQSCDAPPAQTSCVDAICAVDSYCCSVGWDSTCVKQVSTVCGQACE